MLKQLKKSKSEGFTIIEVMIVLAIAGLILLIVFLAVPALQRGGRNTQRKNDAANLESTATTYESNNNGALPTGLGTPGSGQIDFCFAGGVASGAVTGACSAGNTETAKIGFFDTGNVFVATATTGAHAAPTVVAPGGGESASKVSNNTVIVELKQNCSDITNPQYSSRSISVWYVTESANGNGSLQCASG